MKVAFLRTAFGREGVGTVTNTTAKLFHEKGIEVCYIVQYFWDQKNYYLRVCKHFNLQLITKSIH